MKVSILLSEYNKLKKILTEHKSLLLKKSTEKAHFIEKYKSVKSENLTVISENSKLFKDVRDKSIEAERLRLKVEHLSSDLLLLKNIIEDFVGGSGENIPDLIRTNEHYSKLLKCTVCDTRRKDTALVKCMHVFCRECIDERIKKRERRCPTCSKQFMDIDIRKVYL